MYSYGGDILLPVDYTANWKKIESERKGGSEGGYAYYIGREG